MNQRRVAQLGLPLTAALAVLSLANAQNAQNPNPTVLTINREDATITITNFGLGSNGARNLLGRSGCEEGVSMNVLYGPPDEVEMVIDDETVLRSAMVIIRRPAGDGEGATDQETVEMVDGDATFTDRPPCLAGVEEVEDPSVRLEQGRTTINAARFFLDREVDVAQLAGPISLERAAEGDSEALSASAEAMTYDLETDLSTLTGAVRVTSGERVSEAERLELDEEAGLATLTGSPARSVMGEDEIEGTTLLYYLDSNDVVVVGGVRGSLEVELD